MYLKKIVAQGFKSFADNTVIDLSKNIAGIVGPNGSGKSNVVDAVRWVLGEQSVKSLRGDGTMTDVIFSGSKSRNPLNVSSVTLVFDNADHYLPIEFDEVSIKRRLYKDGTNEFFINNEKVRLKDVADLLIDSGIAKESFNIISQGKIEEILSNKPSDRRVIFEEAAGVLKYKKRKEEALRKLERTHDNMNRVQDIIKELEVQVEPLREQKIKALEYLDLTDELKDLEVALVTSDITNINTKYQENKKKIDDLTTEITGISTNNSSNEAKIEEYKLSITNLEKQIKADQETLIEMTTKVEKINSQKEIIIERKKYEVDDAKLHNNLVELKETKLKLENELNNFNLEIKNQESELNELNKKIEEVENNILTQKNKKNDLDYSLTQHLRNSEALKTQIDSLSDMIESNGSLPFAVRNILNNPKLRGIHDIIGNVIEVGEEYSKAISVTLGANTNNIIVDNETSAKEAISYLKTNNSGRATFFPMNIIKEKYVDNETITVIKNIAGYIDTADNLVKYDLKYKDIVKNQLGNVLVVSNIDIANQISKKINYKYRIVTLDGELLHVGGSLTGGNIKQRNIITDKYDLENKIKEQTSNELAIKEIENKLNENSYELKSLEDKLYLFNKDKMILNELITNKQNTINELDSKIKLLSQNIDGTNNIINETLSEEENNILEQYYSAVKEKDELINQLNLLSSKKEVLTNELNDYEYSVKKDNSLFNIKNKELHDLEIEVNRSDVKLDTLLNLLNENYNMTYEYACANYKLEMDQSLARNKVNALKRSIRDLGPVNTAAPEEYDRVSVRYEFLIKQQEDLTNAENTLLEIIKEMDNVMEQEFVKTFKVISSNFTQTFKELFKGGTAELQLTNPNDLLETGIEITACPPGKSLKSISLLSGGEKTFTAISLLFAILKSRPVPFCILDEVEAALDEVNVESFGEYLRNLNTDTQFIIITHKKKTMEFVDILYGITMQESGVSKLVSVKLEDLK